MNEWNDPKLIPPPEDREVAYWLKYSDDSDPRPLQKNYGIIHPILLRTSFDDTYGHGYVVVAWLDVGIPEWIKELEK